MNEDFLAVDTCWTLLRTAEVGRLAVCDGGHPDIFPLNFLTDHGTIVFRTGQGRKLSAVIACPDVAFEVDGYDAEVGQAWSVVLQGRAEEVTTVAEVLETMTFPLFPWHTGSKHRFVRIVPVSISGRRFRVLDSAAWRTPLTDAHRSPCE